MSVFKNFEKYIKKLESILNDDDYFEDNPEFIRYFQMASSESQDLEMSFGESESELKELQNRFKRIDEKYVRDEQDDLNSIRDMMYPDNDNEDENDPMDEQWI